MNPKGTFAYAVLRPVSDLFLWAWRVERRVEWTYRPAFDRWLRPPLFAAAQALQQARRHDEHLALAEERELPGEEGLIRSIIEEISAFTRENWLPGSAQRFGNTKTFGVVRGELTVSSDLPERLRHGLFAQPGTYPAWVRFAGPGPYAPPDLEDYGQCSVGIKVMGVPGDKLLPEETGTQDIILVTPASFVTPDIAHNAVMQRWVRAKAPLGYVLGAPLTRGLQFFMQMLYSPVHASPLEVQYYSNVPFLLGAGQAVQYSLRPRRRGGTRIPRHPGENYLRDAMVRTLAARDWSFDLMVQVQTDPHRMPVENASVHWPERLSPYVPVARLTLPQQRFDSDAQLAFSDVLRYNPWHALAEHRPLGNSNRARQTMYAELAALRQAMNADPHVEPTGDEQFDGGADPNPLPEQRAPAPPTTAARGRWWRS